MQFRREMTFDKNAKTEIEEDMKHLVNKAFYDQ